MNGQTITIASGIILLIVFALVGWNLRRKSARDDGGRSKEGPVMTEGDRSPVSPGTPMGTKADG